MSKRNRIISLVLSLLMLISSFSVFSSTAAPDASFTDEEAGVYPFDDVERTAWYGEGALFCRLNGYMNGTSDYIFSPNTILTRAQIAVIFSVIANVDTSKYADITTYFTDVKAGSWYEKAVKWMVAEKMTAGITETTFCPDYVIDRSQLCLFVMKLSEYLGKDTSGRSDLSKFTDSAKIPSWARESISYAVSIGITTGYPDGSFGPAEKVSRAQIGVITKAYVMNVYKADHEHEWTEPNCTDASYCTVCGLKKDYPLGHDCDACVNGGICGRCEKTVAAFGHSYKKVINVQATCTKKGEGFMICRRCGDITEYLPDPLKHTTDNGICLRCGKNITKAMYLLSGSFIDPLKEWSVYDALIARIKSEQDLSKRTKLMHEAEDILMSNGCVVPLYYYNDVYLQKSYADGIYSNPYATKYFMYAGLSNGSKTMKICLGSEPYDLDPALNSSVDGACLAANSFSGLYTYDENGRCVPACAESYTVSADGLTYTVRLRSGLKWSDGSALTAADFEYSWKRAASDDTGADYVYMFSVFKGYPDSLYVNAIDSVTLEFELNAPCAYMEDLMAFPTFYPVKKSAVESAPGWRNDPGEWCREAGFVSNGAYVCKSWNHDVSITYEKNPYWYDADKVTVEKLEFMLSADDDAIMTAYDSGNLDFTDLVDLDHVASGYGNPELHIVNELGTYYAAFNAGSPIFSGKTPEQAACMRLAFSMLIDRKNICESFGLHTGSAANSFIPVGMADGKGGIFRTSSAAENGYFDPEAINKDKEGTVAKAVEFLEAAGYKFTNGKLSAETPIRLDYITNDSPGNVEIAELIRKDLAVIGIELTIKTQDRNTFLINQKNGNYDFAREGWIADFNDPINMLEMWTTDSGNNQCRFGR